MLAHERLEDELLELAWPGMVVEENKLDPAFKEVSRRHAIVLVNK